MPPTPHQFARFRRDANALRAGLIRATLDTALTFVRLAHLDFACGETVHAEKLLAAAGRAAERARGLLTDLPDRARLRYRKQLLYLDAAIREAPNAAL